MTILSVLFTFVNEVTVDNITKLLTKVSPCDC